MLKSWRSVVLVAAAWGALACNHRQPAIDTPPIGAEPVRAEPARATEPTRAETRAETLPPPAGGSRNASSVAVVELFTSEGCSSCPAADENLARITEDAAARGRPVLTLELHVDYWDYLGWVDPFSSHAHTLRQHAYAKHFGATGMYTPQMVVNGREELVGSNAGAARAAIERALLTPAPVAVSVRATRRGSALELSYSVSTRAPVDLQLAVADDRAETRVTRGENADRRLLHRHVVRVFHTLHLSQSAAGEWSATWPEARAQRPLFVAAYVTDPKDLSVLGAASQVVAAAD
jgi:hypothetical protein